MTKSHDTEQKTEELKTKSKEQHSAVFKKIKDIRQKQTWKENQKKLNNLATNPLLVSL